MNQLGRILIVLIGLSSIDLNAQRVAPPSRAAGAGPSNAVPRIVGGTEAPEDAWPWMVALIYTDPGSPFDNQFCGASLIHPRYVLTAAHCLEGLFPSGVQVIIGSKDLDPLDGGARVIDVEEFILHPAYGTDITDELDGDIALIRLAEPVTDVPLLPLNQAPGLEAPGVVSKTMGWGLTVDQGEGSPRLLEVDLPIVSLETAQNTGAYDGTLTPDMLAAGFAAGGKDSCQGDSGGPLIVPANNALGWAQAGVVSFGPDAGCAAPNAYGIYARVSYFYDELTAWMYPSFVRWAIANQVDSAQDDRDGDGLSALEEYVFQTSLDTPNRIPITFDPLTRLFSWRHRAGVREFSMTLERTQDLRSWTAVNETDIASVDPAPDGSEWVRFAMSQSGDQEFIRCQLGPAPDVGPTEWFWAPNLVRVTTTLSEESPSDPTRPNGQFFTREFVLDGLNQVDFGDEDDLEVQIRPMGFTPRLTLIDEATGEVLDARLADGPGEELRFEVDLDAANSYRLRVSSVEPETTGEFEFNFPPIEFNGSSDQEFITLGETVSGVLDDSDLLDPEFDVYSDEYLLIGADDDQRVEVTVVATGTDSEFSPVIFIYDFDSFDTIANSDFSVGRETSLQFVVPDDSLVIISVENLDEELGPYELTVTPAP